jgi:hypothetical protein
VSGAQRLLRPLPAVLRASVAVIAVLVLTVPTTVGRIRATRPLLLPSGGRANLISANVSHLLAYLKNDPRRGGVLTDFSVGALIPGETGRPTYIGDPYWSQPGFEQRAARSSKLVSGNTPAGAARQFVLASGAQFVVADSCRARAKLMRSLGPLISSVHRFGCDTVYTIANARIRRS